MIGYFLLKASPAAKFILFVKTVGRDFAFEHFCVGTRQGRKSYYLETRQAIEVPNDLN